MNRTLNIADYFHYQSNAVEQRLQNSFPEQWEIPSALKESMLYSLMAGGKRLRPILVLAAAEALEGSADAAMPVACAVEMIHTYSLIHDDLPSLDNDDYRRGKWTNHKVYGEAMAILAGDALLTHAFYQAVQAFREAKVPAEQVLVIVEELSYYSGSRGMVGGQVADIEGEQGITDIRQLEYIHTHKTSDLIVFSLKAGGRIAGADHRQIQALEQFGLNIGLAFQIQDDILDIIGDEKKLGKKVNSDIKLQKVTYPYLIGLEACKEKVEQLTLQAKQAIRQAGFPYPKRLLEIADYLMDREY